MNQQVVVFDLKKVSEGQWVNVEEGNGNFSIKSGNFTVCTDSLVDTMTNPDVSKANAKILRSSKEMAQTLIDIKDWIEKNRLTLAKPEDLLPKINMALQRALK